MANTKLRLLYEADQADRTRLPIDWNVVSERDRQRRAEVRKLIAAGECLDAWDHYWAAVVLIHSRIAEDLVDSFAMAGQAFSLDPEPLQIRAFYALAKDRLLVSRGEPQIYGTQKVLVNGKLELAPIDWSAATDTERQALGIPGFEERQRELEELNRPSSKATA